MRAGIFIAFLKKDTETLAYGAGLLRLTGYHPPGPPQAFQQFVYNRLLFCCRLPAGDVIFALVSKQCPQGPARLGNSSHLNVAELKVKEN
jgi:hypothetical protein